MVCEFNVIPPLRVYLRVNEVTKYQASFARNTFLIFFEVIFASLYLVVSLVNDMMVGEDLVKLGARHSAAVCVQWLEDLFEGVLFAHNFPSLRKLFPTIGTVL